MNIKDDYSWQDVMIEYFGPEWLKQSYTIIEIGELAEELVKYKRDHNKMREGLKRLSLDGEGTHKDRKESVFECLEELQIEYVERKEFARQVLRDLEGEGE